MSPSTIYLISGANRGIGLGFVTNILKTDESAFVYAGARTPEKADALIALKSKYPEQIAVVKCISADCDGNAALANEIEERHGRVDTVIANAAIGRFSNHVGSLDIHDLEEHFHINVTGTVVLFQSLYNLLKKSANPKFVPISTPGASISAGLVQSPIGGASYGSTKAALNWVTRKIHFENEWIIAFPLSPGGVETDMVSIACEEDKSGMFKQMIKGHTLSPDDATALLIKIIDGATREGEGGQFVHIDGSRLPW